MDTLRGHDAANDQDDFVYADDAAIESPHAVVEDERRMQVRAYNYWASLLGDRSLPSIEDLSPDELEDFGPHSVLLDFTLGIENPAIVYLGTALREECGIEGSITHIDDVPARSLLSRLTDHYLQIIANEAPIGFEAEFVNQRGADILYRGILMPFSSNHETIDFVFGVINWKELASREESRSIQQEVDAAMRRDTTPEAKPPLWPRNADVEDALNDEALEDDVLDLAGMESPADDAPLTEWLDVARKGAEKARTSEARSHAALYRAIGLCYDFALASRVAEEEYAQLLIHHGVKAQARSPMTAVLKLVFGASYDKTRITEYATALDHGWANGMGVGTLADYLSGYDGGLKALVRDERALRRAEAPPKPDRRQLARSMMKNAVALNPVEIATDADGFAIVVTRREADGSLAIVAALPEGSDLGQKVMIATAR